MGQIDLHAPMPPDDAATEPEPTVTVELAEGELLAHILDDASETWTQWRPEWRAVYAATCGEELPEASYENAARSLVRWALRSAADACRRAAARRRADVFPYSPAADRNRLDWPTSAEEG